MVEILTLVKSYRNEERIRSRDPFMNVYDSLLNPDSLNQLIRTV